MIQKISYILFLLIFIVSCDDMHDISTPSNLPDTPGETGQIYVLSEGLFNLNNSSLCRINFNDRTLTSDFFTSSNGRGLGDTANDMKLYDNKLWIVVNVSSQIEVVDLQTGISIKRIPLFDENEKARQPRYITFDNGKAYVCSFDGTVTRIDISTLTIDNATTCGQNPDGIAVANNKLYVSNSGGLNIPDYDSTVSVINLNTFKEIKKITVGLNPYKLEADSRGNVYVAVRGNNSTVKSQFCRINSTTDELEQTFGHIPVSNFTIQNDTAYLYYYSFKDQSYQIQTFDCTKGQLISDKFISDSTTIECPFGISVNPQNGNLYITDAKNYTLNGDLLCFNRAGKLLYKLMSIGLNPNTVIAIP